MARTKTNMGQALWQPGGAEEDSRFCEDDRHLRLAYDDDDDDEEEDSLTARPSRQSSSERLAERFEDDDPTNGKDDDPTNGEDDDPTNGEDDDPTNGEDDDPTNGLPSPVPVLWLHIYGRVYKLFDSPVNNQYSLLKI